MNLDHIIRIPAAHSRKILVAFVLTVWLPCATSGASDSDSLWAVHIGSLKLRTFDDMAPNRWYDACIQNFKHEEDIDDPKEVFYMPEYYVPWTCKQFFPGKMRADSVAKTLERHLKGKGLLAEEEPGPATSLGLDVVNTQMVVQYIKGGRYRFSLATMWSLTDAVTGEKVFNKPLAITTPVVNEAEVPYQQQLGEAFVMSLDFVLNDPQFQQLRQRKGTRFSTTYYDQPVLEMTGPVSPASSPGGALKSVVTVIGSEGTVTGTVVSSDGYLVCGQAALKEDATEAEVRFNDGTSVPAKVARVDRFSGLVLLKVEGRSCIVPDVKESELPEMGDDVNVLGTPGTGDLSPSMVKGILSGYRSIDGLELIQTDAPLTPGNAGGPLLDTQGNVLGVIIGKVHRRGVEGLGFALKITAVEEALRIRIPR